jgi:transposase-like protein
MMSKWPSRHSSVATGLEEAGDRFFTIRRLSPGQRKSARTTNTIERLYEEFRRRVKTQTVWSLVWGALSATLAPRMNSRLACSSSSEGIS